MLIEVHYDTKNLTTGKPSYNLEISYENINGNLERKDKQCVISLEGEEYPCIKVLRLVWELTFLYEGCLLYTSPSPRDPKTSRMPSSA